MLDALNIHFLVSITTLYLTTDLNVRVKIINLLEGNTGKKLHGLKLGNDFLDLIPKHKRQEKKKKQIHCTSSKSETFVLDMTIGTK